MIHWVMHCKLEGQESTYVHKKGSYRSILPSFNKAQILINCVNYSVHIFACYITFRATVLMIWRNLQTIDLRRYGGLLSSRARMKLEKFNRRHLWWSLVCSLTWEWFHACLMSYNLPAIKVDTSQGDVSIIYAYTHRPCACWVASSKMEV